MHLPHSDRTLIEQRHGDAVRLFPGGAGSRPHAQAGPSEARLGLFRQHSEVARLAKEIGFICGQKVDHDLMLAAVVSALQEIAIRVE
jgi:hypothetical protein